MNASSGSRGTPVRGQPRGNVQAHELYVGSGGLALAHASAIVRSGQLSIVD
jgi:hypothetical protein